MGRYPDWLYQAVIEDDLPWHEAKECSFQEFSEKYTLHDSHWLGLFHDVAYENNVTLVIVWDPYWLPAEIAQRSSFVAEWPFLFVRIENVSQVSTSGYVDIEGVQRGIAMAEIERVDRTNLLVVSDHYGGSVEISFVGRLKFLAFDVNQKSLSI